MRSNKLKPLVIGDITIEHPLALAPMAGVTDLPYRLLCKEQGAGMMCTEMVSDQRIILWETVNLSH